MPQRKPVLERIVQQELQQSKLSQDSISSPSLSPQRIKHSRLPLKFKFPPQQLQSTARPLNPYEIYDRICKGNIQALSSYWNFAQSLSRARARLTPAAYSLSVRIKQHSRQQALQELQHRLSANALRI